MSEATGAVRGEVKDERVARRDEQIARRIEQFKRKCGEHGEEALNFAYHAALPVALNPEFLHLLRINFFVDIESPLPYEVEYEFLLSSLCRQIDEGLYEVEREVRLVLLEGLAREFGQERMREVAMLLWEYVERQEPWVGQVGLERAQQLTSVINLDADRVREWLYNISTMNLVSREAPREWLIAVHRELDTLESAKNVLSKEQEERVKVYIKYLIYRYQGKPYLDIQSLYDECLLRLLTAKRNNKKISNEASWMKATAFHVVKNHAGSKAGLLARKVSKIPVAYLNSSGTMEFNGRQQQQFQQALLSAFPSKNQLAKMLSFELDWQLDAISGGQNLSEIIFHLIQYAQSEGSTDKLLAASLSQKPGNPNLCAFAQQLGYSNDEQPSPAQQYLKTTFDKLTENGATQLLPPDAICDRIAKITDFEPGLGMRGDAFFLFSTFGTLTPAGLRSYSAECLNIAQSYPASSSSRALFNFRIPTRCCFSIAIVQHLDSNTATAIRNNNPFKDTVDVLWYEIPIVFDLSQQKLVYYQEASNILENFRGEIVWKKLRETIQKLLDPASLESGFDSLSDC